MPEKVYSVLFLCTGNSARSIMAEALLDHWGRGRFKGYSAGSLPTGVVHPLATALIEKLQLPAAGLRSKSWDEFAGPDAPAMDFVVTVCDRAAGEACPWWPGAPLTAHWSVADPASVAGSEAERQRAFRDALTALKSRIKLFVALPLDKLGRLAVQHRLDAIGRQQVAVAQEGL